MPDHRVFTPWPVLRASAVLAVAGGALRVANSFTTDALPGGTLALLYLATDVFVLAGIAGMWWYRRRSLGTAATTGIVIFVAGILAIRAAALGVFGAAGYQIGATIALLGLSAYSIETLLRRGAAPWAPVSWLVSLVCALVGVVGVAPPILTIAAGVAFGAGFVAAGVEILTVDPRPSGTGRAVHPRRGGGRAAPGRIIGGGRRHHGCPPPTSRSRPPTGGRPGWPGRHHRPAPHRARPDASSP